MHLPTSQVKPQREELPLTWNILDPRFYSPESIDEAVLEDYIGLVVNLLSPKQLMGLTEPMKNALTKALRGAYKKDLSQNGFPMLDDLLKCINELSIPNGTRDALTGRLENITQGTLRSIFCEQTSFKPEELFTANVCVKMKHLTQEHRYAVGLLTFFILSARAA